MTKDDPWRPGLRSQIPARLLPLSTMFRSDTALRPYPEAQELSAATGLTAFELAAFRPERLVAHEVLIRVTADLHIPDGPEYADLGVNLRGMVNAILDRHIAPEMADIVTEFDTFRADMRRKLEDEAASALGPGTPSDPPAPSGMLSRLLRRKPAPDPAPKPADDMERALSVVSDWSDRATAATDPLEAAGLSALARIAGAILRTRGRLLADPALLADLATAQICNLQGSRMIGRAIESTFARACAAEGYTVLPPQTEPVIMNVKGASAAGKSTMRSLQRELAGKLDVPWAEFALISPDYWRKFLLDYDSLGENYKYAAALTGHELAIIDLKLDSHMAQKAECGKMTHLLIDRFRFDSFSAEEDKPADSKLLTRFGRTIFLFFVVTPPEATVDRAWIRGLQTGRYKAVDDLLHHNVEAFTGMPQLFFSWILSQGKDVHVEFLDNNVAKDARPRTIASGRNGRLAVYDIAGMLNVERFRKINIEAQHPGELYQPESDEPGQNLDFLRQCLARLDSVELLEPAGDAPWAVVEKGVLTWRGDVPASCPPTVAEMLEGMAQGLAPEGDDQPPVLLDLAAERASLVGQLG